MNHFIAKAGAALLLGALCAACEKSGPSLFAGNYSFKTSGYLDVQSADAEGDSAVSTLSLATRSGQMDITPTGTDGDRVVITMNETGGDLLVYYATASDDLLTLEPAARHRVLAADSLRLPVSGTAIGLGEMAEENVTVSGTARRYDNIVLFDLRYEGTVTMDSTVYTITGSHVNCRAKLNE